MRKLLLVLAISILIQSCGTLKSVPYPSNFNSLDSKAVNFNLNSPKVELSKLTNQSHRLNQDLVDKEILVSVSGGGARAAAFSLGVLAELENLGDWTDSKVSVDALKEIDYFSTVSGGGWGVSSYLADKVKKDDVNYKLNDNLQLIKKNFLAFSDDNIDCLPSQIEKHATNGLKMGHIFNQDIKNMKLPYLFINGTIYSNQSPFVFTQGISDYYRVDEFLGCEGKVSYKSGKNFNELPVSFAVASSGSVPGFYHNYATTHICNPESDLFDSFYCAQGKSHIDKLILVDGGIYDNYGYQTALEVISQTEASKVIIIIDSNADTEIPFERDLEISEKKVGINTIMKAGFPARTSAYNKMFKMSASLLDVKTITLDFFSVADFVNKTKDMEPDKLLYGLDKLKAHSETKVYCFDDDGTYINNEKDLKSNGDSMDCKANNYYRSGLMGKTTYKFDDYYFAILEELGRLAVRVNANEIKNKLYN